MQTVLLLMSCLYAITMLTLAFIGGTMNYSSVPYWDMWDASYKFYIDLKAGQINEIWKQHNEHRIVLSKLLFWVDYEFFGGKSAFLIFINYLLLSLGVFTLIQYTKKLAGKPNWDKSTLTFNFFLTGWIFSWVQHENIVWGFQSQFFLSVLLPLIAFFFLASSIRNHNKVYFSLACIFGVLSAGTMANGILTLPLMVIFSLISASSWYHRGILTGLSIITVIAYFYGYHSPSHHPNILTSLTIAPYGTLKYLFYYLGSPFYSFLMNMGTIPKLSTLIAVSSVMLLIGYCAWLFVGQIRSGGKDSFILALLLFISYVGGTALITAGGRYEFGLSTAFSSRYTTPAVFAFAAFFILMYFLIKNTKRKALNFFFINCLVLISLTSLHYQLGAVESTGQKYEDRKLSALALAMNINDADTIRNIYPNSEFPLSVSQAAIGKGYGVFADYPFLEIKNNLGQTLQIKSQNTCLGALDSVSPIKGVTEFVKLKGWIFDNRSRAIPRRVDFINKENVTIGFALTGIHREDVAKIIDLKAEFSGFQGYARTDAMNDGIYAFSNGTGCKIPFSTRPILSHEIIKETPLDQLSLNNYTALEHVISNKAQSMICSINTGSELPILITSCSPNLSFDAAPVKNNAIIKKIAFDGVDYERSSIEGWETYGTGSTGDWALGEIKVQVHPGEMIFYRTGPISDRQTVTLESDSIVIAKTTLPVTDKWSALIVGANLPALDSGQKYSLTISDEGDNWGEWTAITLHSSIE